MTSFFISFSVNHRSRVPTAIDLENPVIDVTPSPLTGYTSSSHGSKVVLLCERVQVAGQSRLELGSYASAYQFQRWRLFCLAFGFVLLLLAPVVSSWVPFYYSGSMAVGVFLVIIILLFQTAAEIGLGDEIITNSEEKCFLPHSIWIGGNQGITISLKSKWKLRSYQIASLTPLDERGIFFFKFADFEFDLVWPCNLTCKMRFDLGLVLRFQFVAESGISTLREPTPLDSPVPLRFYILGSKLLVDFDNHLQVAMQPSATS
ncbi:hypothetical protein TEA_028784 [Camellia sinensis var. sinensis]|uniref:Uncharacterized protein n=1 Tax=Camellia sinensis var. sinensis TaxID=542762 RepID=A0A4S4EJ49_CAMSN|nr:hypothetical protein TEA_028784 [Camellia sinensis var. sinensis]